MATVIISLSAAIVRGDAFLLTFNLAFTATFPFTSILRSVLKSVPMKSLISVTFIVLLFSVASFAQKEERQPWVPESFTLEQLIAIQTSERVAVFNKQESEFRLLIGIQQVQMERSNLSGDDASNQSKLLIEERSAIQKEYAQERSRLAEVHKLERQQFQDRQKQTPPAVSKP